MCHVLDIISKAEELFEAELEKLPHVPATQIGLDVRAGYVWVDTEEELIIVRGSRSLDYYGGFEYVPEDARSNFGNYTIYSADSERVADAVNFYEENHSGT